MTLKQEMEKNGFYLSPSGGGCMWYSKELEGGWFMAITERESGIDAPVTYGEPIVVCLYNPQGDHVQCVEFDSSTWFFMMRS